MEKCRFEYQLKFQHELRLSVPGQDAPPAAAVGQWRDPILLPPLLPLRRRE